MSSAARNYAANLIRLARGNRLLRPLAAVYYVTTQCNLRCVYCEDFGQAGRGAPLPPLPLAGALRLLRVVRAGTDRLVLTGGEPLLHPDAEALLRGVRELGFRHVTLLTNGSLLAEHETLLPLVDRLVVSLDAVDPVAWSVLAGVPVDVAQTILDNVRRYAQRQRDLGLRLVANCVLGPETLPGARSVLEFCREHGLLVSFSPQAVNNWPRYELLVGPAYRELIAELIAHKQRGAPILGSARYLRTLLDFAPYRCYPTLIPRILPGGDLVYPCWPVERAGAAHGGRPCNLLDVASWDEAVARAVAAYGLPPRLCTSCFQQCYAEPSLMQARPLALLGEWLGHRAARHGGVATYAPG